MANMSKAFKEDMQRFNESIKDRVMNEDIKHLLEMALNVLISSNGEISTDEGYYATVDSNYLIDLDAAFVKAFGLSIDSIGHLEIKEILKKIKEL